MATESLSDQATALFAGYSPDEERPLAGYATLVGAFNALFAAGLVAAGRSGRMPDRVGFGDLLLFGAATEKLSRVLAKDKVTSFIRAPFTRYQEKGGPGEIEEEPRGHGLRLAVGELAVCSYCLAQWVAAGFLTGSVLAPRKTRFVAAVFATIAISDFIQLAYKASEERA